jgi:two-component system OmpR family response regulator
MMVEPAGGVYRRVTFQADPKNSPMKKKKILVVDDEAGFTRLLKLVLRRYDIREVNDSKRALETAQAFQPDLILLDVVMPGIDGGNLAATIKADTRLKRVPIIFVTAVVSPREAGDSPKEIGGFPFLAKPVSPDALERCIEQHLVE